MDESRKFFLKEKPVLALISIRNANNETYCGEIAKEIDSTYAHTVKIVAKMKEMDLIRTREEGRKKMVSLSDDGKVIAKAFQKIVKLDDEDEGSKKRLYDKDIFSK